MKEGPANFMPKQKQMGISSKVFSCLKCGRLFPSIPQGQKHQETCAGIKKGFKQLKKYAEKIS